MTRRRDNSAPKPQRTLVAPVTIVADGALATHGVGHGRLIPVVIIDTAKRPDIEELVRLHEHTPPGDVHTLWGLPTRQGDPTMLRLSFTNPMLTEVDLLFELPSKAGLVDLIIQARALRLQPGRVGDRVSMTTAQGVKHVLLEVLADDVAVAWERLYLSIREREMRSEGFSKGSARPAARMLIHELRKMSEIRVGD